MSAVMLTQRVEILKWFAMQDAITQMEILAAKHQIFINKLKEKKVDDKSLLELRCLIFVARQGWQAEQNCKKGKAMSENEAAQISVRRRRRAREFRAHRDKVQSWLRVNFGKMVEYRHSGLSWRRVALLIEKEHGLAVSHTTVRKYYVEKIRCA